MRNILVVDDDPGVLQTVTDILSYDGYRVIPAAHGAEALQAMRRTRPDVVLLDLMMPVMDGWTFARACRSDPTFAEVPIIVMSAAHDSEAAARTLGAQGHISKPFDLLHLLDTVGRVSEADGAMDGPERRLAGAGGA
jgi:CheY-like chemotaxis protein